MARTKLFDLLLDKISESCIANYHHINIPFPSSFFDALTHQEYLLYLQRCIEKLGKIWLIEQWEEEAERSYSKERHVRKHCKHMVERYSSNEYVDGHSCLDSEKLKRISFIMTFDHKSRQLDNVWWYFNRCGPIIHNTFASGIPHKHQKMGTIHGDPESNKALKNHVADLKVEIKKMQKFSLELMNNCIRAG